MPRRKQKPHEQKVAEQYFPVEEGEFKLTTSKDVKKEDLEKFEKITGILEYKEKIADKPKISVEKSYSKPDRKFLEKVEKVSKKKIYKKKVVKTKSFRKKNVIKKKSKIKEFASKKISLKKDGYELIITEKPQAASKIASALGKVVKRDINKIPYYEVNRDGKKIMVACAVGHLFTLKQINSGSEFPVFGITWVPNHFVLKKDFSKKYYDAIGKLVKDAGSLTVATDFDVEGEVIGMNIIRHLCGQKDASRMKFSTLTSGELNNSYENKLPHLEWGQAIAGETRHYLDWFYGINLSRALMSAIKSTGRFKIMSIGRVQGPSLNLIVKKEREIQAFSPRIYWQIFITVKNSHRVELKHNKDIFDRKELAKFENLVGKHAQAETKKTEQKILPNPPFNLTTLQTEAYKFHGITPSGTLQIAQSLYLSGLISYPRTSSEKLPDSINYREIVKKLTGDFNASGLIKREKPVEGKKSDPAHPSIYPTGEKQILSGEEEKIYNLIVRRFLSLFCEDAVVDNKKITAIVDGLAFSIKGLAVRKRAWMEIYPVRLQEKEIPDLDGEVSIISQRTEEKETQPPKRFTPASIISELEKRNLGTKSTRASILETLYDRGYVKDKSITATPIGMSLISTLEKYSPIIIDDKLTRNFEKEMEFIQNSKKGFEKKEEAVIEKAKKIIIDISGDFEKHKSKIGNELVSAQDELREQEKIENTIMQCPKCGAGNLRIMYSRKTRRYFVACDKYPECTTTFSLPPNGLIKKAGKICGECGFPKLIRLTKGRRPWEFCFNRECSTNSEWIEKAKKKREEYLRKE